MNIDLAEDEWGVAGLMWSCEGEPWVRNVLLTEATRDFRTDEAERKFIELLKSHEDDWLETLAAPMALPERRARARAAVNVLRRLRR